MSTERFNILYVDDEEHNLDSFVAAFRRHYMVHAARSAREGMKILREQPVDIIVTDQRMPEMTGVQFLEAVIAEYPEPVRMILTGFSDIEAIIDAINTGRVFRYITKPWDEHELKMTIDSALEYYTVLQKNKRLLIELHQRVTEQERIIRVFERFVPANVVEKALRATDGDSLIDGESRIVSVLFADIRGFTGLTSALDPKITVALLNDYFHDMAGCVLRGRGTVVQFLGDGLLAVFGAPVSSFENHYNAVHCALDMKSRLPAFNVRHRETLGRDIHIGIGVHTGEVVAGNIGTEEHVAYAVIGDTVNVASRIEYLTHDHPDTILISDATHRLVSDAFNTIAWAPVDIRGKQDKLVVHEVLGTNLPT